MNNDLISRAALLKEFDGNGFLAECIVRSVITTCPVVDAEPVRHGRWIHCNGKSNLWYCSECGEKIIYNPTRKTYKPEKLPVYAVNKRCRNCGAKMDREVRA